jgi:GAF domain-containing protein/DNA-binding response OmpR family regulator
MPKKPKINNRLNKLFQEIHTEEATTTPGHTPHVEVEKTTAAPAAVSAASKPIEQHNLQAQPAPSAQKREAEFVSVASAPVHEDAANASSYSLKIQTGYSEWSMLRILDDAEREWTTDEQLLVQQVSDQLSLALENAHLFQETQERAEELSNRAMRLKSVSEIASATSSILDLHELLEVAVNQIRQRFDLCHCHIFVIRDDQQSMGVEACGWEEGDPRAGTHGMLPDLKYKNDKSIVSRAAQTQRAIILNDVSTDPDWDQNESLPHVKSEMAVPILAGEKLLGVLSLHSNKVDFFTEEDILIQTTLASQISVAIENARLFQEAQKQAEELNILNEMALALSAEADILRVSEISYQYTSKLLDTTNYFIALYDEVTDEMRFPLVISNNQRIEFIPRKMSNGLTDYVLRTKEALLLSNNIPSRIAELGITTDTGKSKTNALSWLGAPLLVGNRAAGAIVVKSFEKPNQYEERERDLLLSVASQVATALENARLILEAQERANELALINRVVSTLTGATNLQEALDAVVREIVEAFPVARGAVTMIDDDHKHMTIVADHSKIQENSPLGLKITIEGNHATETVLKTGKPYILNKPAENPDSPPSLQAEFRKMGIEYTAIFPVFLNDAIIGTLGVDIIEKDVTLSERQINLIEAALAPTSTAISRLRAEEALNRRNEYLAVSAEIGKLVTSTLDLNTIFARTVNLINERFGFYHAGIFIMEETGFNAVLREATGAAGAKMKENKHSLQVNTKSVVGKVASEGRSVIVNDVSIDPSHKPNPLLPETRAEAAIPLKIGNRVIGAIDIQAKTTNAFTGDEISVLQTLADQIAISIDNARSFELSQQAVMDMREADRLKSQFLANMSHELRTPLNSIIGFSRVILKGIDGPVTELQQQDLTAIYNSGQHLLGLINDILDFSKIEAGKMELAFDEVNMADITSSVLSTMSGLVKDKPVQLKSVIDPDLPTVRADTIRIRQVLINLLSNASKFTDEGDIVVKVELKHNALAGRNEVCVGVTDTGPGISAEDQKKLFQAFSQVDDSPTRKTGGTGLGLAICQELVKMHGGRIWVDSEVGRGSTFNFTLQLFRTEKAAETASKENRVILAIDDDKQVISLYERYLQPQGYQVVSLLEPARALERVKQLKPFAVTLDIMMPNIDGWQVLDSLKSDPETRDTPIIVCSILDDFEKGFSLGAADYLVKPILEDDLVNALDRLNADGSIREVLVIDDDPNDLRLLGKILTDDGRYKATLAEGGRNGWDLISSGKPPHAVVLDLFMPEMNGFDILGKMRAEEKLRDVPVIVISGVDLDAGQKKQLSEMGQSILSKGSLNEKELLTTIQRALERVRKKD